MFFPDVSQNLNKGDRLDLITLFGQGAGIPLNEAIWENRTKSIEELLDSPAVFAALLASKTILRYELTILIWVRHVCRQNGVIDAALINYVASIICAFGLKERAWHISSTDTESFLTLHDLLAASRQTDERRSLMVSAHLGNQALWLAGIFPDWIEKRRWKKGGPDLDYFEMMGQEGWRQASRHALAKESGLGAMFERGVEDFGKIRAALNNLSDSIFWPHVYTPERVIRQVETGFNLIMVPLLPNEESGDIL